MVELSHRDKDNVAPKASNIYYLALRKNLQTSVLESTMKIFPKQNILHDSITVFKRNVGYYTD